MEKPVNETQPNSLPLRGDLRLDYIVSLIVALLMTIASVIGLFFPRVIYLTDDAFQSFVVNDVVNLFIGLPILLVSMWLTRRGKLVGLLFWPGALLYSLYNYTAYIFGMPFSLITFAYVALVLLSAYGALDLYTKIDGITVKEQLTGAVPVRITGWILIIFGLLFTFRAISMLLEASKGQALLGVSEIGVLIADLVLSAIWIVCGVLLLRRKPLGFVSGLGLLFSASMLFIGLIMFLVLQPFLTEAPFDLVAVFSVFLMGLICFIPFGLYLRGVLSGGKSS